MLCHVVQSLLSGSRPNSPDRPKHERLLDITHSRIVPNFIDGVVCSDEVGLGLWEAACGLSNPSPMMSLSLPKLKKSPSNMSLNTTARRNSAVSHNNVTAELDDDDVANIVLATQASVTKLRPMSAKSTRSDSAESARGGAWSIRPLQHTASSSKNSVITSQSSKSSMQLSFQRETSALHAACWFGQYSVAKCLLESGVSANLIAHSALLTTPLHDAASSGHVEIVSDAVCVCVSGRVVDMLTRLYAGCAVAPAWCQHHRTRLSR